MSVIDWHYFNLNLFCKKNKTLGNILKMVANNAANV